MGNSENASNDRLLKKLRRETGKAVSDYSMIEEGDHIMVCLSGGKDSYTLLDMLLHLQRVAPVSFALTAVNLDQKQPNFPAHVLPQYLSALGVRYNVIERDTYSVVKRVIEPGKTTCGLCSRLRRGTLYGYAEQHGVTKIALGHHRDDIIETLFLNLFNGGKMQAMPPKLLADDKRNIVIRPLAYCRETDIEAYARWRDFPIIPCDLCGSQPNLQRQAIKAMLRGWDEQFPGRSESIFQAIRHVAPSQLADPSLFDFSSLEGQREPHSNQLSARDSAEASLPWALPEVFPLNFHSDIKLQVKGKAVKKRPEQHHLVPDSNVSQLD